MSDNLQGKKNRKKENRKKEVERTRKNRVLIGYIEKMYPHAHEDACQFYEELNEKYPHKLDLRRTGEFEMTCYNSTKRRPKRPKKQSEKRQDNMVLTIPLLPQCQIPRHQPDNRPQQQPDNMPQQQPDNMPQHQPDNIPQQQPDNMPQHQPDNRPFPMLTDEMVNEIIRDLQQSNPGFERWFEDIDDPNPRDLQQSSPGSEQWFDDMDEDINIDINIDDLSPLEVELAEVELS